MYFLNLLTDVLISCLTRFSDYDKRVELYNQSIWTCRCTGHTTMTHEEALKSEQAALKSLRAQFQECFEKPVLQLVHHSEFIACLLNSSCPCYVLLCSKILILHCFSVFSSTFDYFEQGELITECYYTVIRNTDFVR